MKSARVRTMSFVAGLLLIAWGVAPRMSAPAMAGPSLVITVTSTAEPSPPTETPTATVALNITPTPTNTAPSIPTATSTPPPPTPTNTPEPPPPDDDDETPTPVEENRSPSDPTATPALAPTATLTPTLAPGGPGPDPAISKSVSPPTATVGETVVYTIRVTNLGGAPATGVVVEDTLPAFLTPLSVTASRGAATTSGQAVRVEIGDLAPGETVEVQVSARVTAPAAAPNNLNLATVSSSSPDVNPDNNRASVPVDAVGPVSLPNTAGDALTPQILALALGMALVAGSFLMGRAARGPARRRR